MENKELEYKFSDFVPGIGIKYFVRANKILKNMNEEDVPPEMAARFVAMGMYQFTMTHLYLAAGIVCLEKLLQ